MKFLNRDEDKYVEENSQEVLEEMVGDAPVKEKCLEECVEEDEAITLDAYFRASYPLIWIRTEEDQRALELIRSNLQKLTKTCSRIIWAEFKHTTGLLVADTPGQLKLSSSAAKAVDTPVGALQYIHQNVQAKEDSPIMLVMHNMNHAMKIPQFVQQLKDTAYYSRLLGCHVILVGATLDIPPELRSMITVYDLALPNKPFFESLFSKLANRYKGMINEPITNEKIATLSSSAVGMTALQGENSLALSISARRSLDPEVIQLEKEQAIKQNEVLEFVHNRESIDDIGGWYKFKEWLAQRRVALSPEAMAYGLKFPKGVLVAGIPGCLSGDTVLRVKRGDRKGGRKYSLKYVYDQLKGNYKQPYWKYGYPYWDRSIESYLLAYQGDRIGYHRLNDVVSSGVKTTYVVKTDKGRVVRMTLDHPLKLGVNGSYVELEDLSKGDLILGRREDVKLKGKKFKRRKEVSGVKYHPYAFRRNSVYKAKLVVEAEMNSIPYDEYVWCLKNDLDGSKDFDFLPPDSILHHKDADSTNDARSNLEVVSSNELHSFLHGDKACLNFGNQLPQIEKIISIEEYGDEETFDVVMDDPFRNFVADGLVVHNCGKSMAAKATSTYLGLPLVKFDVGKVFQSLLGQSEATIRAMAKTAEAVAPVVLWIEEIEKSAAGSQSSGSSDNGTTARVMATLLTWMQETTKPIFFFATCNNVDIMPPELYRKGRFTEIWGVAEPDDTERRDIWAIKLKAVRPQCYETAYDYDELVTASAMYTGAEIEVAVENAMFDAFDDGREFETSDLVKSITEMVGQHITAKKSIDRTRDWMKEKVRMVSKASLLSADEKKVKEGWDDLREIRSE